MTFRDDTNEMEKRVADAIFKACSGYMLRINCDGPARAAIEAIQLGRIADDLEHGRIELNQCRAALAMRNSDVQALVIALTEAADRLEARGHKFGAREAWRVLSDVGAQNKPQDTTHD